MPPPLSAANAQPGGSGKRPTASARSTAALRYRPWAIASTPQRAKPTPTAT